MGSTRNILDKTMKGDNILYQYFLEKHMNLVKNYGLERMAQEIEKLKSKNSEILENCVSESTIKDRKDMIEEIPLVSHEWCQPYFDREVIFLRKIRGMNKALLEEH